MLKILFAAALAACIAAASAQTPAPQPASVRLKALLDDDLAAVFRHSPWQATVRGVPGYDHLLPDLSFATLEKERARERDALEQLKAIDARVLRGQDRVSYELLRDKMEASVEAQRFARAEGLVLSTLGGVQNAMPRMAQTTPFRTADNYRDFIKRISATPKFAHETIERLRAGMKSGWLSPVPVLDRVVAAIDAHVVDTVEDSTLLTPFRNFASGIPEDERAALSAAARRAIAEDYQPALRRFKAFIVNEYRPMAPQVAGLAALPGGAEYYEFLIRTHVVRGMKAAEIHQLGLRQVERLRREIGEVALQTGFKGTTDTFIESLRTDKKYFFDSSDSVLAAYREVGKRVDPQLPKLFHATPRMPYAVRAMTPSESASSTAANYMPGSLPLGTSGYFTINALGYKNEATWRTETLFMHEAMPGHHMQIARAAEMEKLHPWRSMGSRNVAYSEGWALYAEKLGFDLGLYKDPFQHYGHLQAELFRAARLVVDTGIHAYNWPRDKAIAYMAGQGGLDQDFAVSEVDRYFSNPSQALGYMLGQRKFLELRARAEKTLGPKFDVRDFHAVVIDSGMLPLAVLEKLVDEWIAAGGGRPA